MLFLGILALILTACGRGGDGDGRGGDGGGTSDQATAAPQSTLIPGNTQSAIATPTAVPPTPAPTAVATEGDLFLQLVSPEETEVFVEVGTLTVTGRTRVDAVVTINDTIVGPNIDGEFTLDVTLEEGPNIIEVVASVASGGQMDLVLVALYLP